MISSLLGLLSQALNNAKVSGGGFYSSASIQPAGFNLSLSLGGSSIENNTAIEGSGGGVAAAADGLLVEVADSALLGNRAGQAGGSVHATSPTTAGGGVRLVIERSRIALSTAGTATTSAAYGGGGVACAAGFASLRDVSIGANSAPMGGGLLAGARCPVAAVNASFEANAALQGDGGAAFVASASSWSLSSFRRNTAVGAGGGVRAAAGAAALAVRSSTFVQNRAAGPAAAGGAVAATDVLSVAVEATSFEANMADAAASSSNTRGAVECSATAAVVSTSAIVGGGAVAVVSTATARAEGRGIEATVSSCSFDSNACEACSGGAVLVSGLLNATVSASNLTDNDARAGGSGGALYGCCGAVLRGADLALYGNTAQSGGAAALGRAGAATLSSSRLIGNTATEGGAAALASSTSLTVDGCTISLNNARLGGAFDLGASAAALSINNTELASNSASGGGGVAFVRSSGGVANGVEALIDAAAMEAAKLNVTNNSAVGWCASS